MIKKLFLLLLLPTLLLGQNQRIFRTLTVKDGLSQSEITGITQDQYGFMWFSTNFGLNKFDGYAITVYNQDKSGYYQTPFYTFRDVHSDINGNVWIAGDQLMKLDSKKEQFSSIPDLPKAKGLCSDEKGNIWFVSVNQDVCFYDNELKKYKVFTHDPNNANTVKGKIIKTIQIDKNDHLWVSYDDVKLVDKLEIKSFYKNNKKAAFKGYAISNTINTVFAIGKKTYFIDLEGNFYLYTESSDKISLASKSFSGQDVSSVIEDPQGNLWIATTNQGMFICDSSFNIRFTYNTKNSNIVSNYITRLFIDKSGVLWMATSNGIAFTDLYAKKFRTYRYQPGSAFSLPEKSVRGVGCDDKGIIWISTDKGLSFVNEKTNELKNMESFPGGVQSFLSGARLTNLLPYENGYMLGAGVGLSKISLDQKAAQFSRPNAKDSIPLKEWNCLTSHYGKQTGYYWIGTQSAGLCCIPDPDYATMSSGSVTQMADKIVRYSWITEVAREAVNALYEDRQGILWIGSSCGLVAYNPTENTSELYLNDASDVNSLSHNSIKCLLEDSGGNLWIGTEAAGLNRFDRKTKKFIRYTTADGLCNNSIAGILEDKSYHLWISTRGGLSCLDPVKNTFKNYDYSDGLPSNEFNYLSFCKTKDGRLCFGTVDGLTVFNPEQIIDNPIPAKTIISKINIYNKGVNIGEVVNKDIILNESIQETKEITLSYRNKVFSIEFIGIHYAATEVLQYKYKLDKFDNDWRLTNANSRVANYTNLPSGEYTFRVQTANPDGIWDEKGEAQIILNILPPWWATWTFRIIILLIFVAGSGALFWGRIKQVEHQKKILQEQVDLQTIEIRQKAEILKEVNNQLVFQQKELQETNVLLEERSEEIMAQKEEIENQAEELGKANATKDKFFSIIGHDLKNPMFAINGLAKMLLDTSNDMGDDQTKEIYQMIEQSSDGVSKLLENLLTWARAQSGRVDFKPESIDLNTVTNSTILLLKPNAEGKGLKLSSDIPANTMAYADTNMVTTVIRNLINNAIKFTSSGSITVRTENFEGKLKVAIVDTGIGMDEASRNKLFRIDAHLTTQGTSGESGTGLGLMICKEFVEINKGTIWVESEPGKGSSFVFTLPLSS